MGVSRRACDNLYAWLRFLTLGNMVASYRSCRCKLWSVRGIDTCAFSTCATATYLWVCPAVLVIICMRGCISLRLETWWQVTGHELWSVRGIDVCIALRARYPIATRSTTSSDIHLLPMLAADPATDISCTYILRCLVPNVTQVLQIGTNQLQMF